LERCLATVSVPAAKVNSCRARRFTLASVNSPKASDSLSDPLDFHLRTGEKEVVILDPPFRLVL